MSSIMGRYTQLTFSFHTLPLWVAIYFGRQQRRGHRTRVSSISGWERDQLKAWETSGPVHTVERHS